MRELTDERAARLEIDAQLVDEMIKAFNLGAAAGRAKGYAEGYADGHADGHAEGLDDNPDHHSSGPQ